MLNKQSHTCSLEQGKNNHEVFFTNKNFHKYCFITPSNYLNMFAAIWGGTQKQHLQEDDNNKEGLLQLHHILGVAW